MIKINIILLIALLCGANTHAQEHALQHTADSTRHKSILFLPGIVFDTTWLHVQSSLNERTFNPPLSLHQAFMLQGSELTLSPKENLEIDEICRNMFEGKEKYRFLKTILISIEAGTTAYLLYEHLHKYGLKGK